MKNILTVLLILSTFLAACAPATPTPDVEATVNAMLSTSVAATLTAQPTDTPLPTNTPLPTSTPEPIITDTPLPTATLAASPTSVVPTATPVAFTGCFTPTGSTGLEAPFKLENLTKAPVTIYINGTTKEGDHTINCSFVVEPGGSEIFTIWFGNYTYWVEGKKIYKGSFFVNDTDKATMQISDKGVKIGPFA